MFHMQRTFVTSSGYLIVNFDLRRLRPVGDGAQTLVPPVGRGRMRIFCPIQRVWPLTSATLP